MTQDEAKEVEDYCAEVWYWLERTAPRPLLDSCKQEVARLLHESRRMPRDFITINVMRFKIMGMKGRSRFPFLRAFAEGVFWAWEDEPDIPTACYHVAAWAYQHSFLEPHRDSDNGHQPINT